MFLSPFALLHRFWLKTQFSKRQFSNPSNIQQPATRGISVSRYLQSIQGYKSLIVLQAQGDEIQICGRESHSRRQSNPRDRVKPCQAVSAQALLQQHRNLDMKSEQVMKVMS